MVVRALQATLVASWLTELYLDQINRALLDAGAQAPAAAPGPPQPSAEQLGAQLQAFLSNHVNVRGRSCTCGRQLQDSIMGCDLT